MSTNWHVCYITDKEGSHYFRCQASEMALDGEMRNLQHHLDNIKAGHQSYSSLGLDPETAHIVLNGQRQLTLEELLNELGEL